MRLIEPMDAKSAISVLNMAVTYNGCGRATSDDLEEALKLAKEALKKQIPEKLLPEQRYYGIGKCSRCGVVFTDDTTKYCGNCGQAIEWGEGEGE